MSLKSILSLPLPAIILSSLLIIMGCTPSQKDEPVLEPDLSIPEWTRSAIWYQIFVERFRNGDPSNDPRPQDMIGADPSFIPPSWSVTEWGHDWYEYEPWLMENNGTNFYHRIQQRRFGGDLQGVMDQLDYVESLGINAVYFNPLNDAPSLHKYDARNWRHIDRNFGPDPDGDAAIMAAEIPDDPSTWQWTTADQLFLDIIKELHQRGIRVILDYSWNHSGREFWAIHDIREKGEQSKFVDWFNILSFDDPDTEENEFDYQGWAGYKGMPVVNKDIIPEGDEEMPFEGNLVSESLKQHIYAISARWLDPNGDGDPSDGVDGFRLDVAGEVPMGFWRDYRKEVRKISPEAYLIGEIWWLEWPETFLGPRPYLGDQFDAIMNYRWYRLARGFFGQAEPIKTPSEFVEGIHQINTRIDTAILQAMMNMSASHDSPRLSTSFYNKTMYKYHAKPNDNPDYKIDKPDERTMAEVKLFLIHQFTFLGAPQIWNGDEFGMWGADDPDCRKPLIWEDMEYQVEKANYFPDQPRAVNEVKRDKELLAFYRTLIAMRRGEPTLSIGSLNFLVVDDEQMTLAYERVLNQDRMIAVFNRSEQISKVSIPNPGDEPYELELGTAEIRSVTGAIEVSLPALGAVVLKRQ